MAKPSLFNQLCQYSTLLSAWKQVKSKGSAGGIDGITISEADSSIEQILTSIQDLLKNKSWMPLPYLRITIPKKDKERRKLGLLSIKDKIVQQAIKTLIEPRLEKLFLRNSYGYRPSKGHTKAVRYSFQCFKNKQFTTILRLDIDNYFDSIDHDILSKRLCAIIPDTEIVRLVMLSVKMGYVNHNSKWEDITKGVPQGGVLSPLLANLYLHSFDQFVLSKDVDYVRYADDFLIFCKSKEFAEEMLKSAEAYLKDRLQLTLNTPSITSISDGIEFLGIYISPKGLSLSEDKKLTLQENLQQLKWSGSNFLDKGLKSVQGIKRYYAAVLPDEFLEKLDAIVISRLSDIITEQWESIANKKALASALKQIEFSHSANIKKTAQLRAELVQQYTLLKLEKRRAQDAKKNDAVIKKRKKEYRKKEAEASELIVSSFGTYIGVNHSGIALKSFGKQIPMPNSNNLRHIVVIGNGVTISSNAIEYCMAEKIPIDYFSFAGKHVASILSPRYLDNSLWGVQARLDDKCKCALAKKIIAAKLRNQLNLIKYYHKYHKSKNVQLCELYDTIEPQIKGSIKSVDGYKYTSNSDYRTDLMSYEAVGALHYWDYIRELLKDDDVGFIKREHQGATDLVNAMLNLGYSLLYTRVWQALLYYKLNPTDSVIHARQSKKPTLVYDVVELFRCQAVDRVVLSLIQKGEPLKMDKGQLDKKTVILVVQNITERLNRYEKYRATDTRLGDIIKEQVRAIAAYITDNTTFKPYIAKW